jgi:transcriptional regulator GlxA family with amidase domain
MTRAALLLAALAGVAGLAGSRWERMRYLPPERKEAGVTRTIGIHVFDEAEELDWAGPWEVFTAWARHGADVQVGAIARGDGPVRCAGGLRVLPDWTWETAPPLDVLVYPGGNTTSHQGDPEVRAWLLGLKERGTLLTSVCTGALVYASVGLLRDRPATTWWGALDRLAAIDETIDVRRDDRWVDDGDVVTGAGVSAGIDFALHLVARLGSVEEAKEVRRYMQYDPEPPV